MFKPRFAPRDVYDWRLSALALTLLLPLLTALAALWVIGIPFLAYHLSGNVFVTGLCLGIACLLWMAYSTLIGVRKVEVGVAGLRYWRGLCVQTIAWESVEAIEQVSRRDIFRLVFSPSLLTGRIAAPGSLTMAGYLRIRHKQGVLLFPPEEAAEFLDTVRTVRTVRAAIVITAASTGNGFLNEHEVPTSTLGEASTTRKARWYHTAYALREENQTTLKTGARGVDSKAETVVIPHSSNWHRNSMADRDRDSEMGHADCLNFSSSFAPNSELNTCHDFTVHPVPQP